MASGFPKPIAAGIIGAMGELQDNIFRHRPETGMAAYASTAAAFELVIGNAGVGVLASLRECADYGQLQDAGAALKVAVAPRLASTSCSKAGPRCRKHIRRSEIRSARMQGSPASA
jgi:hypothetical protein